jgi:hypothetical protein
MKIKVNIRDHLEGATDHNGDLHVSACLDLEDLFEGSGIPEETEVEIDVHELLAENRQIAHIWGLDDVQQQRPDLDDDQAWEVLQLVEEKLDCNVGITREIVERIAEVLYPVQPRHWQGRIDVRIADTDGYGQGEVINRLRDMAQLLAQDMPDVEADVDPGSVRLLDSDETTTE